MHNWLIFFVVNVLIQTVSAGNSSVLSKIDLEVLHSRDKTTINVFLTPSLA